MDLHVSDYYYRISNSYLTAVTSKYLDPYTADDTLNSNEYKQWQVKMVSKVQSNASRPNYLIFIGNFRKNLVTDHIAPQPPANSNMQLKNWFWESNQTSKLKLP